MAAKRRKKKSKPFLFWVLLLVCIVLAGVLITSGMRIERLKRENRDLGKKVQQLQKEIDAKNQQIGDLEIRLKIYEKGSIKQ